MLVAFARLGSRGHVSYWRGAAHRVSQDQEFDVLFAADPTRRRGTRAAPAAAIGETRRRRRSRSPRLLSRSRRSRAKILVNNTYNNLPRRRRSSMFRKSLEAVPQACVEVAVEDLLP